MWHTEGQDVDDVYRSARWTTSYEKSFSYRIPVLCGRYKLVLHFSEIVQPLREPGKRIFKLLVQGRPSLESLDIVREAGFRKPLTKSLDIEVTDGLIEVDLVSVKKGPLLS